MPSINNSPASGRTPCRKGQIRTKVIQYRCVNTDTFHDKLVNKLNNASPRRSSRKSRRKSPRSKSSSVWYTPKSRSSKKPTLRRFSPNKFVQKPSIFNEINRFDKNNLNSVRLPNKFIPKPSIFNEISRFDKNNLKSVRLPNKFIPKPSIINEISRFDKKKLKSVRSKSPTKISQGILKSTNENFNNFRKQLLSRRKILKKNSGSDNNNDEWIS